MRLSLQKKEEAFLRSINLQETADDQDDKNDAREDSKING
jgi:hypothetical protein